MVYVRGGCLEGDRARIEGLSHNDAGGLAVRIVMVAKHMPKARKRSVT